METIAVYWESQIKVYGISMLSGLSLARILTPITAFEKLGKKIQSLGNVISRFELVTQDYIDSTSICLNLVFRSDNLEFVKDSFPNESNSFFTDISILSKVDMVFLHGPHFQDRYGIADPVFDALNQTNIDILLASCAGTSVYVVVPEKHGQPVTEFLKKTFLIPTTS